LAGIADSVRWWAKQAGNINLSRIGCVYAVIGHVQNAIAIGILSKGGTGNEEYREQYCCEGDGAY
jgi:hypothetical protein